jgi:hypothetical protein
MFMTLTALEILEGGTLFWRVDPKSYSLGVTVVSIVGVLLPEIVLVPAIIVWSAVGVDPPRAEELYTKKSLFRKAPRGRPLRF